MSISADTYTLPIITMIEMFQLPFMQRALLAGVVLAAILAYLGIFVVLRKMSFFSDGVAHASLAGVAIGIMVSVNPLITALLVGLLVAVSLTVLERTTKLSSDSIIGLLFTAGMAFGVLLLSFKSGYQPELISFLFGNILAIRNAELILMVALSFVVLVFLVTQQRKLLLMSIDPNLAKVSGISPVKYQLLMNIFLAVSVVLGIKLLGVILVSALLLIPVSSARLVTNSFKRLLIVTIILSEVVMIAGLVISYFLNLPSGAVIVLTGTLAFFAMLGWGSLRTNKSNT
ncbi:MAG: metal ABC transporter permease [Patescibacteria group bacterium]|jgi:zinc transport system permease protein